MGGYPSSQPHWDHCSKVQERVARFQPSRGVGSVVGVEVPSSVVATANRIFLGVEVFNAVFFWLQNYTKFHGGGFSIVARGILRWQSIFLWVESIQNGSWKDLGNLKTRPCFFFFCKRPGFPLFGLSKWWVLMGYPPRMTTIISILSWLDLDGLHITTFLGEVSVSRQITRKSSINRIFIIIHQP